jgi:hypothetical protein
VEREDSKSLTTDKVVVHCERTVHPSGRGGSTSANDDPNFVPSAELHLSQVRAAHHLPHTVPGQWAGSDRGNRFPRVPLVAIAGTRRHGALPLNSLDRHPFERPLSRPG